MATSKENSEPLRKLENIIRLLQLQIFEGKMSWTDHALDTPVNTKFIRFHVKTWNQGHKSYPCMRVELYDGGNPPTGVYIKLKYLYTNQLAVSVHQHVMSVHQPVMSVHQPVMSVHQPVMSVHQPVMSVHQPVMSVRQPVMSVHQPVMSVHQPVVSVH